MGTNYYLLEKPPCECCGRPFDKLHIGKSSGGWTFLLHVDDRFKDLDDWVQAWSQPGATITDEYDEVISPKEMMSCITERSWPRSLDKVFYGYSSWQDFHAKNGSEPGPNNLLRSKISDFCVKHGSGTWDCITGEFS